MCNGKYWCTWSRGMQYHHPLKKVIHHQKYMYQPTGVYGYSWASASGTHSSLTKTTRSGASATQSYGSVWECCHTPLLGGHPLYRISLLCHFITELRSVFLEALDCDPERPLHVYLAQDLSITASGATLACPKCIDRHVQWGLLMFVCMYNCTWINSKIRK